MDQYHDQIFDVNVIAANRHSIVSICIVIWPSSTSEVCHHFFLSWHATKPLISTTFNGVNIKYIGLRGIPLQTTYTTRQAQADECGELLVTHQPTQQKTKYKHPIYATSVQVCASKWHILGVKQIKSVAKSTTKNMSGQIIVFGTTTTMKEERERIDTQWTIDM